MILDFYTYYLRRMETRPDQRIAINSCKDMALGLFEKGPLTWSIESGAALLSALHEIKLKPGIDIMPIYDEVETALLCELQGVRLDIQYDREARIKETGCGQPKQRNRDYRKDR